MALTHSLIIVMFHVRDFGGHSARCLGNVNSSSGRRENVTDSLRTCALRDSTSLIAARANLWCWEQVTRSLLNEQTKDRN